MWVTSKQCELHVGFNGDCGVCFRVFHQPAKATLCLCGLRDTDGFDGDLAV